MIFFAEMVCGVKHLLGGASIHRVAFSCDNMAFCEGHLYFLSPMLLMLFHSAEHVE